MRFVFKLSILLIALAGLGAASYRPAAEFWRERYRPQFQTATLARGEIIEVINATGKIEPVLSVHIGAFVSGPVSDLYVEFNDEVKAGDMLAKIDPRIYEAGVARDQAALDTRTADVKRIEARLQNAKNNELRALALRSDNPAYIADTELDQFRFDRLALEAELLVAQASVKQAQANLDNSLANLKYTNITSPVDGIVIDRLIDPGQTLASQFQTPELFVIAPDMRKEMHVFASVDEMEIGKISQAREAGKPVKFTVAAYPGELFEGQIFQIRLSSDATDNVVTYPVVISAPNPDLKLLPGMTADVSFEIEKKTDVLKIPNSALRFYPEERDHVREADWPILDGTAETVDEGQATTTASASEKAQAERSRHRRHVWVNENGLLKAVEVITGITDWKFTELVSGDLQPGQPVVTGVDSD
jgi:HlyD family secretion protein